MESVLGTRSWRCRKMIKTVFLQIFAAAIATALSGVLFGVPGAISAALGGAACIIPAALFVFRLQVVTSRPGASFVAAFLVGELIKIVLGTGLLALIPLLFHGVHWGAVIIGLIVTLQANFFAFLLKT